VTTVGDSDATRHDATRLIRLQVVKTLLRLLPTVADSIHTARRQETRQFRRVGVDRRCELDIGNGELSFVDCENEGFTGDTTVSYREQKKCSVVCRPNAVA